MASFTAAKAALDEMVAPVTASMSSMVRGSAVRPRNWSVKSGSCTFVPSPGVSVLSMPMTFVMVPSSSKATAMGTWLEYPFDCAMTA